MLKAFFFLVVFGGLFKDNKSKKAYLKFLMIFLFLTIALRNKICFLDTYGYVKDYDALASLSFNQLLFFWNKDISFWYFTKLISMVSNGSYMVWFSVLAFCYVFPLYNLLNKYSKDFQISLILFCCLGFALFSMTGLRQTLAMSCTMSALYFLLNEKVRNFFIFVFLAALFHKTAIVFILLYPLSKFPLTKKYSLLYIIVAVVSYILIVKYLKTFMLSDFDSRFEAYLNSESSINYSGLIQQILLFTVSFIFLGKNRNNRINRIFIWMSLAGIFFQSMTNLLPEMFRISMYFSIANVFLLANSLTMNRNANITKYAIILALVIYFVTSPNNGFLKDYYFSFQSIPDYLINQVYS